ncbi:MAG: MATE family efflux transporter [Clostridia bacterium]|nr:MATE family efflux transporter [Clostridia bacterium]
MFKKIDLSFYKTALTLALPIALQNLLTSCATLIDTAMVVSLGDASISAMGAAGRFSFLLNIVGFGFASGCTSLLSQYWGAKESKNLQKTLGVALTFAMSLSVIYGLLLFLFPEKLMTLFSDKPIVQELGAEYLRVYSFAVPFVMFSQVSSFAFRSVERVVVPLVSSVAAVLTNIFFNYCLIFGNFGFPRMELRGAALATAIGMAVQALILLGVLVFRNNPFRGPIKDMFDFDAAFVKKYSRIALPVLLNETLWGVGTNVYAMVIGRQGIENHAGYTMYENIQQLFFVFFVGICGACAIMVGKSIGAGDHEEGFTIAKRFAIMTPLIGVFLGIILFFTCEPILSLFDVETEASRQAALDCLRFYGLWLAPRMIPYTLICGIFRAGGDTMAGWVLDMIGLYMCGIPAVLITGFLIRPERFVMLIAVMFMSEDIIKSFLGMRHFFSKKWIKQITDKKI